jgi:hypothetical protein
MISPLDSFLGNSTQLTQGEADSAHKVQAAQQASETLELHSKPELGDEWMQQV